MQSSLLGGGEVHHIFIIMYIVDALDGWMDMHDDGQNLAGRDRGRHCMGRHTHMMAKSKKATNQSCKFRLHRSVD